METEIRATKLSEEQLRLAEAAYNKLGDDWQRILDAVGYWQTHGRKHSVVESPRLDDAVTKFKSWLDGARDENGNGVCTRREHSRKGLRIRIGAFANSIRNLHVDEITPDTVEGFLGRLNSSATTKDNYRRAVSRFFSWCIERPRRWATTNPCREIRIDKGEKAPPVVLSIQGRVSGEDPKKFYAMLPTKGGGK